MTATETEVQMIPLEKIVPNPDNRQIGGFDPMKLQELADSIKEVGLIQPITVRPHSFLSKDPTYELVAGERRWRAAKIAGLTEISAIVRELDDMQVLKIWMMENLQREDVHPLDEADGYARLLEKAGYDVEQIAQELDKSASYVYQRLKLKELIEPARKLFIDGTIAAGHAILIARLGAEDQEYLMRYLTNRNGEISVKELDMRIQQDVLRNLSKAGWKRDDAELVPAAGACSLCPKRTGFQPALFADVCNDGKSDYCLDRSCFQAKAAALIKRRELELSGAPFIRVSEQYGVSGTVNKYDIKECKKSTKGGVRTLMVDGPRQGQIGWALPAGQAAERQAAKEDPKQAERMRKERAALILGNKIARRMHRRIWETVTAAAAKDLAKRNRLPEPALRLVVDGYLRNMPFQDLGNLQAELGEKYVAESYSELLLTLVQILVAPALNTDNTSNYGMDAAKKLAEIYGVDLKALEREVKAEIVKPKGPKLVNVSKDGTTHQVAHRVI
jgi:ParB/RepB/Spo0J family partition protein